jgi:hypothetical protein
MPAGREILNQAAAHWDRLTDQRSPDALRLKCELEIGEALYALKMARAEDDAAYFEQAQQHAGAALGAWKSWYESWGDELLLESVQRAQNGDLKADDPALAKYQRQELLSVFDQSNIPRLVLAHVLYQSQREDSSDTTFKEQAEKVLTPIVESQFARPQHQAEANKWLGYFADLAR